MKVHPLGQLCNIIEANSLSPAEFLRGILHEALKRFEKVYGRFSLDSWTSMRSLQLIRASLWLQTVIVRLFRYEI